jgi:hypothetical protein
MCTYLYVLHPYKLYSDNDILLIKDFNSNLKGAEQFFLNLMTFLLHEYLYFIIQHFQIFTSNI